NAYLDSEFPRLDHLIRAEIVDASLLPPALLPAQNGVDSSAIAGSTVVGPANGTVIVVGGGRMGPEIYSAFIEAAGGPDALIIDVPNAGGASSYGDDASGA